MEECIRVATRTTQALGGRANRFDTNHKEAWRGITTVERPQSTDDALVFADDEGSTRADSRVGWHVLVVDDDDAVHEATQFALSALKVQGRPLVLSHARSASEAREILERERDIAVILLDVVMESDRAGLDLVRDIRGPLGLRDVRIILRTGQPGYAPEISTIRDYDVNDYKTKSELTHARLFATLTTSIRSYSQIKTINESRAGLSRIAEATARLLATASLDELAEGLLATATSLVEGARRGAVVALRDDGDASVLATVGFDAREPLPALAREAARRALESGRVHHGDRWSVVPVGSMCSIVVERDQSMSDLSEHLFELLSSNASMLYEHFRLLQRLREQAFTDALCAVRNRAGLIAAMDESLRASPQAALTLALIDIEQFAEINDALGHRYGDRLLQAFAARLTDALAPSGALIARVSSDVFGVLAADATLEPARLRALLRAPFTVETDTLEVSATMGFVRLADVEGDGADALKEASIALQRAKHHRHEGDCFFTRRYATEIEERVTTLRALRGARQRGELFLVYQPQLDLRSGAVIGFEALLRWKSAERGFVAPDRFIPIAERSGLIVPIGEWVLEESARMLRRLTEHGYRDVRMSANVALSQFRHPSFLAALDAALASSGAPERFELEITESMAMDDAP